MKLERVLGLTVSSNASLATAPSTGKKPGNTKPFDVERVKLGKDYSVKIASLFFLRIWDFEALSAKNTNKVRET